MNPQDRQLHESATYARTPRLLNLLQDTPTMTPRKRDIAELWETYSTSASYTDNVLTLKDFAQWILGFQVEGGKIEPCEVCW